MRKFFGKGSGSGDMKEEKEPSLLSFKVGREGTVSKMSPLMRRFKTPITPCTAHDLHAASSRQLQSRHVSAALHLHMVL
jgi:hypothetical protein